MTVARKEKIRALKFTLFSITAGIIEIAAFTFLSEVVRLTYWPAYLIALVLSVLYNFTINRKVTFHSAANVPVAMLKVFGYYCVFTPLSTIGGDYLTDHCGWNKYVVLAITMILNFVTEYLFTRFLVYGKQVDNDAASQKNLELPVEASKNDEPAATQGSDNM